MPDRIIVFCTSRTLVSQAELIEFIDDMCFFDETPKFNVSKEEAETTDWRFLEVRYDPELRPVLIHYENHSRRDRGEPQFISKEQEEQLLSTGFPENHPDLVRYRAGSFENETMIGVIAEEVEELASLEGAEAIISHLNQTYQFFMMEFGWTATEECHEMTEALASYLAKTYDGIIMDGTGYYNSSFDYLLKYPE
jgi:hypothetical protein